MITATANAVAVAEHVFYMMLVLSKKRKKINIFGKLSLNEWKGKKNVEFIIDDISVNKTINNSVPSSNG